MKRTFLAAMTLALVAIDARAASLSSYCWVIYEQDGSFVKGPEGAFAANPVGVSLQDSEFQYHAWAGAMLGSLELSITRLDTNSEVSGFSGAILPNQEQTLRLGNTWFTCRRQ